jgi:hypothetical protein
MVMTGLKPSSLLAFLELNDGTCQQNLQAVVCWVSSSYGL